VHDNQNWRVKNADMNISTNDRMQPKGLKQQILSTITFLILPFFLAACGTEVFLDDGPDEVIFFESIAMGQQGAVRDTLELILRDQATLEAALPKVQPFGEIPEIDWSQMMVGLIAIPAESGGYIVEVQSVERTGEEVNVHYQLAVPGEDCITVQALALPHQIVIIRKTEGNVTFVRERERYSCGM